MPKRVKFRSRIAVAHGDPLVGVHLISFSLNSFDEIAIAMKRVVCITGHMRPSSPLLDSVRDQFEDYDQLAKDFTKVFLNEDPSRMQHAQLFDIVFMVGQSKQKTRLIGVRAILAVRSRVFQVCIINEICMDICREYSCHLLLLLFCSFV